MTEEVRRSYPTTMRLWELEGENKDLLLMFLRELERRKMIWSQLERKVEGGGMERVWYGNHISPTRMRMEDALDYEVEGLDYSAVYDPCSSLSSTGSIEASEIEGRPGVFRFHHSSKPKVNENEN